MSALTIMLTVVGTLIIVTGIVSALDRHASAKNKLVAALWGGAALALGIISIPGMVALMIFVQNAAQER